ncbi:unnamed protein product [Symbiodinium pilosum]|uniref:Uncharacterized protein n=1 Tax=Symbiodinium pilosum TaxID=2952 RepID=A0A812NCV5_SYMPI|nr:unnamed protein product [Symbiodinium pilosum]
MRADGPSRVVSWDDVSRGTADGSLSSWGANVTDTCLKSKSGKRLFTVRSENWNERVGVAWLRVIVQGMSERPRCRLQLHVKLRLSALKIFGSLHSVLHSVDSVLSSLQ